jgi:hypothetical protein
MARNIRRKTKAPSIIVEERTREDRWHAAGQRLRALDLERFDKVLVIAEGYVASYGEQINESHGAKWGAN